MKKLTRILSAHLAVSLVLVVLLFIYGTKWGQSHISAGLLSVLGALTLISAIVAMVAYALTLPHGRTLERIEIYLRDFRNADDAAAALSTLPPFPVGAEMSIAAVGWNHLLGQIDRLRNDSQLVQARESIEQYCSGHDTQQLHNVVNTVGDGILVVNATGEIVLANRSCQGKFGCELSDLIGRRVRELFEDTEAIEVLDQMLDRRMPRSEMSFKATVVPGRLGGVLEFVDGPEESDSSSPSTLSAADVTDNRDATMLWVNCRRVDGARSNSDIVITLHDITQQTVGEASRGDFIAHVSHELRSPLTNIRAYTETLLSDMVLDAATQKEAFNVINEETGRLILLVNDVLDLSRMEVGSLKLNQDEVVMDRLVHQCVTDLRASASSKKITLQTNYHPKLPKLYADREKLSVVINNIVSNAIKYTPENGTVFVETNVDDDFVYIKVSDTGFGISPEDLDKIFQKFYRVDRQDTADVQGTGLGLTISKEIMNLHGGDVSVSSELNQGSEVTIKLPRRLKSPVLGLASND